MRMGEAMSMAELMQDDREGIAALLEALLLVVAPPAAFGVEDEDSLLRAEVGILRIGVGAVEVRRWWSTGGRSPAPDRR